MIEMELSEKELHCVARLIQGGVFGKRAFDGCWFCKYRDDCQKADDHQFYDPPFYKELAKKITLNTGVDIEKDNDSSVLPPSLIPFRKFLKNADVSIKEYFKSYFSDC